MSSKRALLCVMTIGALLVLATLLLGHVGVFIIIVLTAFAGIAWSSYQKRKSPKGDRQL